MTLVLKHTMPYLISIQNYTKRRLIFLSAEIDHGLPTS